MWAPLKLGLIPQRRVGDKARPEPKPAQSFEKVAPENAFLLLGTYGSVVDRAKAVIQYARDNKQRARLAGIETAAIELSGLIEDGSLRSVLGSLEASVKEKRECHVSSASLDKLKHAESVVSDAAKQMDKLGQTEGGIGYIWVPFAVIGAAAVGVAVLASKPKKPLTIQVPGMKNGRRKTSENGKLDGSKEPVDGKKQEEGKETVEEEDKKPTDGKKKT